MRLGFLGHSCQVFWMVDIHHPKNMTRIVSVKLASYFSCLHPTNVFIPNVELIFQRDVGSWLGELNLRQYEPNFIEGGFDDIDFIKDLDRNDLEMIDIKKKGHQKKILLAVRALNELELTAILDRAVAGNDFVCLFICT